MAKKNKSKKKMKRKEKANQLKEKKKKETELIEKFENNLISTDDEFEQVIDLLVEQQKEENKISLLHHSSDKKDKKISLLNRKKASNQSHQNIIQPNFEEIDVDKVESKEETLSLKDSHSQNSVISSDEDLTMIDKNIDKSLVISQEENKKKIKMRTESMITYFKEHHIFYARNFDLYFDAVISEYIKIDFALFSPENELKLLIYNLSPNRNLDKQKQIERYAKIKNIPLIQLPENTTKFTKVKNMVKDLNLGTPVISKFEKVKEEKYITRIRSIDGYTLFFAGEEFQLKSNDELKMIDQLVEDGYIIGEVLEVAIDHKTLTSISYSLLEIKILNWKQENSLPLIIDLEDIY